MAYRKAPNKGERERHSRNGDTIKRKVMTSHRLQTNSWKMICGMKGVEQVAKFVKGVSK